MKIECPACSARFLVSPKAIGQGRKVKCARCTHVWFQKPIEEEQGEASFAEIVESIPESVRPVPKGSSLPVKAREYHHAPAVMVSYFTLMLLVFVGVTVYLKDYVVHFWPPSAAYYEAIGVTIPVLGEGLVIENLRSAEQLVNGENTLRISGQIKNISKREVAIPLLKIAMNGSEGTLYEWIYDTNLSPLQPGEVITFQSVKNDPIEGAVAAQITFVPLETIQ